MTGQHADRPDQTVVQVYVTADEIDTLAVALARSVFPDSTATDAWEASAEVWRHGPDGGRGSLATMLAEARSRSGAVGR